MITELNDLVAKRKSELNSSVVDQAVEAIWVDLRDARAALVREAIELYNTIEEAHKKLLRPREQGQTYNSEGELVDLPKIVPVDSVKKAEKARAQLDKLDNAVKLAAAHANYDLLPKAVDAARAFTRNEPSKDS